MKKKKEYNFIIFLIIISVFGLGLIYLTPYSGKKWLTDFNRTIKYAI